jgi:hypothetical protein
MFKTFIIVALILGVFAWYLRFMQEASELEGFTDSSDKDTKPEKIKSIMKRVDEEAEISNKKKVSFKQVRSLAGETADKWSIFSLFDKTAAAATEIFGTILKTVVAPFLHRIERLVL